MLQPTLEKNDSKAKVLIWTVSIIVFVAVVILSKVKLVLDLPFNVHVFATVNAVINSMVAVLLVAGLITAKSKNYAVHKKIMLSAIVLSVLFLVSYICHTSPRASSSDRICRNCSPTRSNRTERPSGPVSLCLAIN